MEGDQPNIEAPYLSYLQNVESNATPSNVNGEGTFSDESHLHGSQVDDNGTEDAMRKVSNLKLKSKHSPSKKQYYGQNNLTLEKFKSTLIVNQVKKEDTVNVLETLIPSENNISDEMMKWLNTFKEWSNTDKILGINMLINKCEPTEVRHLWHSVQSYFHKDIISLLPKELALHILSYLEPNDLLKSAQICHSWQFLSEDNLLWRKICLENGTPLIDKSKMKYSRDDSTISPWKASYISHRATEMNWRVKPIRIPKVLHSHNDHVITCLHLCDDQIVSGSYDTTLQVWSAKTGKCLHTLVGHYGGVLALHVVGNVIISGSTDRTLKVWNAEKGLCTNTLHGHTSTVRCLYIHGNKVVSGSRDTSLRLWNINTAECLSVYLGHQDAIRCVHYNGHLIISGSYDKLVKVWDAENVVCLHTLVGHTNRIYSLQFDGTHIVSGSYDNSIRVWDVNTGTCKYILFGNQSLTSGIVLKDNILISRSTDSSVVRVWNILTGQCLQTLLGPNNDSSSVMCLHFDTRFIITSSDDGTVKLWDFKTGQFIRNILSLSSIGGVVWHICADENKLVCSVFSVSHKYSDEARQLYVLDFEADYK